jgi:hypothetical protein
MKIFARAILYGALFNIFMYIKQLTKYEVGKVTRQGQLF